jgi:hypothetical protein
MVKELQQAKVDAINAKTSESMTQRKLADTEADLKQVKDEAARASKEAEQARSDAQTARGHRQRPRTNSQMRKGLEWQPKRAKRPAKTLTKHNQVSAIGCDHGSGVTRLIPKRFPSQDFGNRSGSFAALRSG